MSESRWFARERMGRAPSAQETAFLAGLAAMLDRVKPAQVDPAETIATAEGPHSLIAVLPHRALGGISIVCWRYTTSARVLWASIGTLLRHDDLDLGLEAAVFSDQTHGDRWEAAAQGCVEHELRRPLELRILRQDAPGHGRAKVLVQVEGGKQRVYRVGRWSPVDWLRPSAGSREAHQVRFIDDEPPPLRVPSGAENWLG